jgi:hypothetical protein
VGEVESIIYELNKTQDLSNKRNLIEFKIDFIFEQIIIGEEAIAINNFTY